MPKPMFIRAMEYLGRFGIDIRKIEPTLNLHETTLERNGWAILTGIPKGSGNERFRREAAKILQEK
jgi:hypothetical protein